MLGIEAQRNSSANLRASILSLWLPSLMDLFFRGSHTTNFVTCGFKRSYNQAAQVRSSKVRLPFTPRRRSLSKSSQKAVDNLNSTGVIYPPGFTLDSSFDWTVPPYDVFSVFIG